MKEKSKEDLLDQQLHVEVERRLEALADRIAIPKNRQEVKLEFVSKGLAHLEKYSNFDFAGSGYCEFAARGTKTTIHDEKGLLASAGIVAPGLTPVINKTRSSGQKDNPSIPQGAPQEAAQKHELDIAELTHYRPDSDSSSESEKSVISWSERPSRIESRQVLAGSNHKDTTVSGPNELHAGNQDPSISPGQIRADKRAEKARKRERLSQLRNDPLMGEWFFFGWDLKEHGPHKYQEVQDLVHKRTLPPGISIHRKEDDLWLQVFQSTPPPTKEDLCLSMEEVLKVQEVMRGDDPDDIDEWFEKEVKEADNEIGQHEVIRVRAPPQFKARYCGKLQEVLLRACRRHFVERAIDRKLAEARKQYSGKQTG